MKKMFPFVILGVLVVVIGIALKPSKNTITKPSRGQEITITRSAPSSNNTITKPSRDATTDSRNTTTNPHSAIDSREKFSYINIKGLPDYDIFYAMNADIVYYGKVCRNISEYMHLVGDKRIYDKQQAILLHKHHYYKFAKSYHRSEIEDMKGDFMSSVVRDYHNVTGVDAYIMGVYDKAKADR